MSDAKVSLVKMQPFSGTHGFCLVGLHISSKNMFLDCKLGIQSRHVGWARSCKSLKQVYT